jgi:hypothetical protein
MKQIKSFIANIDDRQATLIPRKNMTSEALMNSYMSVVDSLTSPGKKLYSIDSDLRNPY